MPASIKLTYFNIQGEAERVRLALALGTAVQADSINPVLKPC
jgi:hypothetical protein